MPNFPNARNYREWTCGPAGWGQGWPGRQIDVCAVPYVKQLVGTCFLAQEAQLGALWWHRYVEWEVPGSGREVQEGEDVFMHVADSLVVQQELRQHFKATSPWRSVCLVLWPIFLIGSFIFLELSWKSCLYIFEIKPLSVASFAIIFSQSEGCLFTLLIVSFAVQKLLSFIRSHLFLLILFEFILDGYKIGAPTPGYHVIALPPRRMLPKAFFLGIFLSYKWKPPVMDFTLRIFGPNCAHLIKTILEEEEGPASFLWSRHLCFQAGGWRGLSAGLTLSDICHTSYTCFPPCLPSPHMPYL